MGEAKRRKAILGDKYGTPETSLRGRQRDSRKPKTSLTFDQLLASKSSLVSPATLKLTRIIPTSEQIKKWLSDTELVDWILTNWYIPDEAKEAWSSAIQKYLRQLALNVCRDPQSDHQMASEVKDAGCRGVILGFGVDVKTWTFWVTNIPELLCLCSTSVIDAEKAMPDWSKTVWHFGENETNDEQQFQKLGHVFTVYLEEVKEKKDYLWLPYLESLLASLHAINQDELAVSETRISAIVNNLYLEAAALNGLVEKARQSRTLLDLGRHKILNAIAQVIEYEDRMLPNTLIEDIKEGGQLLWKAEGNRGMHDPLVWSCIPTELRELVGFYWDEIGDWVY